jgi:hypothetical protein
VQFFKVAINAKGVDCWHVYKKSVLVIDGKNNNDNGMLTGKNNNNNGMITGRVCNDDKQERNNDSIGNDETMRNCCLQAQEDEHRA